MNTREHHDKLDFFHSFPTVVIPKRIYQLTSYIKPRFDAQL